MCMFLCVCVGCMRNVILGYTVLCSSNGNCFMACICRLGSRNWQLRTAHRAKLGTGNLWQLATVARPGCGCNLQPVAVANALCENLCASALILIFSPLTRRTTTTTTTDCSLLCSSSVCSSCLRWPFLAGFCWKFNLLQNVRRFCISCSKNSWFTIFVSFRFVWFHPSSRQRLIWLPWEQRLNVVLAFWVSDLILCCCCCCCWATFVWGYEVHLFMPDSWHAIKITCAGMRPRSSSLSPSPSLPLPLCLPLSTCSLLWLWFGATFPLIILRLFLLLALPFKGCVRVLVHLLCTTVLLFFLFSFVLLCVFSLYFWLPLALFIQTNLICAQLSCCARS